MMACNYVPWLSHTESIYASPQWLKYFFRLVRLDDISGKTFFVHSIIVICIEKLVLTTKWNETMRNKRAKHTIKSVFVFQCDVFFVSAWVFFYSVFVLFLSIHGHTESQLSFNISDAINIQFWCDLVNKNVVSSKHIDSWLNLFWI